MGCCGNTLTRSPGKAKCVVRGGWWFPLSIPRGTYDYGIYWYLYLDGSIEFEAKLTGILYCGAAEEGKTTPYGRMVAPNVNAMIHEHYFNVRLDMNVDGDKNSVVEVEADLVPSGPDNPHGNAHGTRETLLETESDAARDIKPELGRHWKVVNRTEHNRMGGHTGYRLVPGANVKPMHQPGSPFMKARRIYRARSMGNPLRCQPEIPLR